MPIYRCFALFFIKSPDVDGKKRLKSSYFRAFLGPKFPRFFDRIKNYFLAKKHDFTSKMGGFSCFSHREAKKG